MTSLKMPMEYTPMAEEATYSDGGLKDGTIGIIIAASVLTIVSGAMLGRGIYRKVNSEVCTPVDCGPGGAESNNTFLKKTVKFGDDIFYDRYGGQATSFIRKTNTLISAGAIGTALSIGGGIGFSFLNES